jgi:bifunctional non-homologous end joining protein LigD
MGLEEYRHKRNFGKSPEPRGENADRPRPELRFVVQKHAATRLHYDLRLELDGVLKSWAVPKGPGTMPGDKHLAVHVEDHPLEYGEFEGVIPQGEYGGGTVLLWDRGTWEPLDDPHKGYGRGELKFLLHGHKLKGKWTLVRLRPRDAKPGEEDKNWLLIKGRDSGRDSAAPDQDQESDRSVATGRTMEEIARQKDNVWHSSQSEAGVRGRPGVPEDLSRLPGAVPGEQPQSMSPQLAALTPEPPEGEGWLHEIKYDGYRLLCIVRNSQARMISRSGQDWTARFKEIAVRAASLGECILDGEIVVLGPGGTSDFQSLQNLFKGQGTGEPVYYVFDLPYCSGFDLTRVPLFKRKEILQELLAQETGSIRYSDHIIGRGGEVFRNACRLGLEGIISKRADSLYRSGRSASWLKIKCSKRQEFVIGGFTEPGGARSGFGALLVGYYEEGILCYAGRVGTGFTERMLKNLSGRLTGLETETPPFADPPRGRDAKGVHWVTPDLVAEVEFAEWTREGVLRHPAFKGLREDKNPREVTRETAQPLQQVESTDRTKGAQRRAASAANRVAGVRVSNPARKVFPVAGITKFEVAAFYEAIAGQVLPHITGRPLTVIRCPEGVGGQCFYQKHLYDNLPPSIFGVEIMEKGKQVVYILIKDLEGLIGLVQMGVIELHPWGSRAEALELPDTMIFDLDPDPAVEWKDVAEGAGLIRKRLEALGLRSFVKTSGGKGLHIVVPLEPKADWDEVKAFAGGVARGLARSHRDRFVATMSKSKRTGKVFIDYFRNSRGATSVAAFSLRAREGAPVSTPVEWAELHGIRPDTFTLRTLRKRIDALERDPWEGYFSVRQFLTESMKAEAAL